MALMIRACNKCPRARLQYENATHPRLVSQLQVPVLSALLTALESHRYALHLDQDNTDVLFNTSELLTEIAEKIAEDDHQADSDALPLLEEALELLQRCLLFQESQHTQFQESLDQMNDSLEDPASPNHALSMSPTGVEGSLDEEQWALVVEPVTKDTLIDTVLALLGTFTTLCSILAGGEGVDRKSILSWIEEFSTKLLTTKLPAYIDNSDRRSETALRIAQFKSALLEAAFRSSMIDTKVYLTELEAAFAHTDLDEGSYLVSAAHADCLMTFVSTATESNVQNLSIVPTVWDAFSVAIANLTNASKSRGLSLDEVTDTHSKRGDLSLLQYQLGKPPISLTAAAQNAALSLKNAQIYYRNASNLGLDQTKNVSNVGKQLIVGILQGINVSSLVENDQLRMDFVDELVINMMEGGLLNDQDVDMIRRYLASMKI